jgi:hypothetical protein
MKTALRTYEHAVSQGRGQVHVHLFVPERPDRHLLVVHGHGKGGRLVRGGGPLATARPSNDLRDPRRVVRNRSARRDPMTYEEFRRTHPAVRHLQRYSSEQRASHAASRRLTPGKRRSVGEFFYTHPHLPGKGFPTPKAATRAAYEQRSASPTVRRDPTGQAMAAAHALTAAGVKDPYPLIQRLLAGGMSAGEIEWRARQGDLRALGVKRNDPRRPLTRRTTRRQR